MFSRSQISALLLVGLISFLATVTLSSQQATTSTTVLTTQRILFQGTVTINPPPGQYQCNARGGQDRRLNFTANLGDRITGSFSSDHPVGFYVMSETYAKAWYSEVGKSNYCFPSGTPDQVLVVQRDVTSLSIDFTINNPGNYRFIFINFDKSNSANINFNVGIIS